MMTYHQLSLDAIRSAIQKSRNSHTLIINKLTVTLTLKLAYQSFTRHFSSWWCITIPSLVTKGSVVQKILDEQTFIDILNLCSDQDLAVTRTFHKSIQFSHKTLWLIMMYHQTKFRCRTISSSEETVETVILWWDKICDLDLEGSTPIFLHDILAHNDTLSYQVWLQMVQQFRRYHLDKLWRHGQTYTQTRWF